MPTPAEDMLSEGFSDVAAVFDPAKSWSFNGNAFAGVASELTPDDPRLTGSGDRLMELCVLTKDLPNVKPTRGDELIRGGKHYRVVRLPDVGPATPTTTYLLALTDAL